MIKLFNALLWMILLPVCGAETRPNILLILSDDHSLPHLGVYGSENCRQFDITPNLDAFAGEGMRFNRAYTAAPQCAPSRTAIFSGRSPVGLGATRFAQPAHSGTPFFTDMLRASGYWVGLDGRHQHLDGRIKDIPHVTDTLVELGVRGPEFEGRFDHFVRGTSTKGKELPGIGEKVDAILARVPEEKPWFLYFGFNQPHRSWGDDHDGIDPAELHLPEDWPDLPEVRVDYARYLAEVRDLDNGFGQIMEVLKERELAENTMVIFMGDNGEALLRGKGTLTTRGTNVPLLIRWLGEIAEASVSEALVSGVDLAPTFLEVAGLEAGEGMRGISFVSELRGQDFEGREYVFAERGWHAGPITRTDGLDLARSVTSERYHFIYNAIPERVYGPVDMPKKEAWLAILRAREERGLSTLHERLYFETPRPLFELYDLKEDPYQLENLAGEASVKGVEKELKEALDRWMVMEGDFLPLPSHAFSDLIEKPKKKRK